MTAINGPARRVYGKEETNALRAEIYKRLRAGKPTRFRQLMTQFSMSQRFVQQQVAVVKALLEAERQQPASPGSRPRDHAGKSNAMWGRELRARKRARQGFGATLTDVLVRMNQATLIFEDVAMTDLDLEHQDLDDVALLYDLLLTMGIWHDRALSAVQGWMTDGNVRARIAKLRDTTGRTPEEIAAFERVAKRLERKLAMRLAASS